MYVHSLVEKSTIGAWGLPSLTLFEWGGRMRFSKKVIKLTVLARVAQEAQKTQEAQKAQEAQAAQE